ncbi:von willebrand factor type a domain-containing protein [Cyclospora cayetanensis]|uniref:von willebrand factor type a domain-containing protein n=1 Tax=Cyclospora cayetanensis TaxID=88456 RepID=A0A1D3CVR3_9EIME|nr:von willebrand factor type a domain-containing protein [Cyclospora cayetanensis]
MRAVIVFGIQSLLAVRLAAAHKTNQRSGISIAATADVTTACRSRVLDTVSVQDSSGSLFLEEWNQILKSTTELIDAMNVGKDASHFAPVTFGTWAEAHWFLDDPKAQDADLAKEEVLKLPFLSEATNIAQGLTVAYNIFARVEKTDPERFSSEDVSRLVLVITDGCSSNFDTKYASKEEHLEAALSDFGSLNKVVIMVVGIGTQLCIDELRHIAGCQPAASQTACPNAKFTDIHHIVDKISELLQAYCTNTGGFGGEGGTGEGGEEEKEEGSSKAGLIAGGVIGGLVIVGGIAGRAYASSLFGSGGGAEAGYSSDNQGRDAMLEERETALETQTSMFL